MSRKLIFDILCEKFFKNICIYKIFFVPLHCQSGKTQKREAATRCSSLQNV